MTALRSSRPTPRRPRSVRWWSGLALAALVWVQTLALLHGVVHVPGRSVPWGHAPAHAIGHGAVDTRVHHDDAAVHADAAPSGHASLSSAIQRWAANHDEGSLLCHLFDQHTKADGTTNAVCAVPEPAPQAVLPADAPATRFAAPAAAYQARAPPLG